MWIRPSFAPPVVAPVNAPEIPRLLRRAVYGTHASERWNPIEKRHHQCLAFVRDIVRRAGGELRTATADHALREPDGRVLLRGVSIKDLDLAARRGILKPGMVIHVKAHFDEEENGVRYTRANDSHHWFIYMGTDASGTPRFADNGHPGKAGNYYCTAAGMWQWVRHMKYGEPKVSAIYDPI